MGESLEVKERTIEQIIDRLFLGFNSCKLELKVAIALLCIFRLNILTMTQSTFELCEF